VSGAAPEKQPRQPEWKELVELSGDAGRAWLRRYREPRLLRLEQLGLDALAALRAGQLEPGRRQLAELEAGLAALEDVPASLRAIHDRWYFGVLAYYEYAAGESERAEACLQQAYDAVCRAIEADGFLILLANHCQEFRLHQARIARSRNDWREVRRYVEEAERMIGGEAPLCVLPGGRPIRVADMEAFCLSLPRPEGTPPYLSAIFDLGRHRKDFASFVEAIYVLPGFVLAY